MSFWATSFGHGPQPQKELFVSFLKETKTKIRIFRTLDWPLSVCRWHTMVWKPQNKQL